MKLLSRPTPSSKQGSLSMTPMIDIVFLLLVFFLMTFRIVPQEGDFDIEASQPKGAGIAPDPPTDVLPLILRLRADEQGNLAGIQLNDRSFERLADLTPFLAAYVGDDERVRRESSMEIVADESLRYETTIAALTAVSGRRLEDGGTEDLITNITITPPVP